MPFENRGTTARRIAVIGGGISGLGAAYHLSNENQVVLFEAEKRLGGHARTILAGRNGDQPVDTGFIVFNHHTYPHLVAMFDELGVPTVESSMSFGVSSRGGRLQYGLASLDSIFCQRRNVVRPAFLRMIRDMVTFGKEAEGALERDISIGDLISKLRLGPWFRDYYLTPFSGAIWSTPRSRILDFPAEAMVRFFRNHGILNWDENHQWFTVEGGSIQYVTRLADTLERRGTELRCGASIKGVRRTEFGVEVLAAGSEWEQFDDVVFATHSDTTLAMLSDATGVERTALDCIKYQPNRAVLHADEGVMPTNRKAWSSWCHVDTGSDADAPIALTYWMNSLQNIPETDPLFVTLNREESIREDLIYDEYTFHHPVFDAAAIQAQDTIRAINGTNRTWFCGAWMRNGFHEDGLASAVEVADLIAAERTARLAAE